MMDTIALARSKLMANRKVVCTGNPDKVFSLASGFKKIFPNAVFLSRSTGWDLTDYSDANQERLQQVFKQCNTFLNCSYIASGVQSKLLELCHSSVKFCDVVNIGSTHEYDGGGSESYRLSKVHLQNRSLALNSFRFSTCHCILGGIKKNANDTHFLDIDLICTTIVSFWQLPYRVPMTVIDQHKQSW